MSDFKKNPEKYSKFQVTIMMERREITNNPWTDASWKALGVMIDSRHDSEFKHFERVVADADMEQYLWSGMTLALYADECESYYYNLMSDNPLIFVISRANDVLNQNLLWCQQVLMKQMPIKKATIRFFQQQWHQTYTVGLKVLSSKIMCRKRNINVRE